MHAGFYPKLLRYYAAPFAFLAIKKCHDSPSLGSVEAQASYGIGLQVCQQSVESRPEGLLPDVVLMGLCDALEGNSPAVPVDVIHRALRTVHERTASARSEHQQHLAVEGDKFLADDADKEGVTLTESGLQLKVLTQGDGPIPSRQDCVRVHYTDRLLDSVVLDSSVERWPAKLACDERGAGAFIPPFSALIFEVELLKIL